MKRLLIVDDSALMRRLLTTIFAASGEFEIETARNGAEALERMDAFRPDVITLDINMPGMDGLECLAQIMVRRAVPVVMVSSLTTQGAEETLEAMSLGAVDFVEKPKGAVSLEIDAIADDLVATVRAAADARVPNLARLRARLRTRGPISAPKADQRPAPDPVPLATPGTAESDGLVLVGCSTGGPPALDTLLGGLPGGLRWPIVIAQHMPATFTGPLARRLDKISPLSVAEVETTTDLLPGHAYIGRGDADVIIAKRAGRLVARPAPKSAEHLWHPSVDRLVASAMRVLPSAQIIGVLMTGMGNDGAQAMTHLRAQGGTTLAEGRETAVVWGMPGSLVQSGGASAILPLDAIAPALVQYFAA